MEKGLLKLEKVYQLGFSAIFSALFCSLLEYKVRNKDYRKNNERRIEGIPLLGAYFQYDVAKYAQADAVGDAIAQHHCNHCDECRKCIAHVF